MSFLLYEATLLDLCREYADRVFENWSSECIGRTTKVKKPFLKWVIMLNTIYDMVTVIKGITLFPTPSDWAKCAPNLLTFHEYLEAGTKKNDMTMKQFVTSIAKKSS